MAEKASGKMPLFYKSGCVDYKSKTSDTGVYATEIVADWCNHHLDRFDDITTVNRSYPYRIDAHDGTTEASDSNQLGERIAMEMFRQSRENGGFKVIGDVLDYQTPLAKHREEDLPGKIDLLAYQRGENVLRILELKQPGNVKESLLRCVLEGYTYLKQVDYQKLLQDFDLTREHPVLRACPLISEGSRPYQELTELDQRPALKALIGNLKEMEMPICYWKDDQSGQYRFKRWERKG